MSTLIKTTLGITVAALFSANAHAGITSGTQSADETAKAPVSQTVKTIDGDGQVGQLTLYRVNSDPRKAAVLGALEEQRTDAYIVQDNEGELYINHLVPIETLPDPTLEVEIVDTYTTEYRGLVFTNKVLDEQ